MHGQQSTNRRLHKKMKTVMATKFWNQYLRITINEILRDQHLRLLTRFLTCPIYLLAQFSFPGGRAHL